MRLRFLYFHVETLKLPSFSYHTLAYCYLRVPELNSYILAKQSTIGDTRVKLYKCGVYTNLQVR